MLNIVISVLAFLLAVGILVAFHEFGHFWVARRLGVKVLRFSIGLGKPIWKKMDKHGTEYVLAAIPLGGYVKMLESTEPDIAPNDRKRAFDIQPLPIRFAVVLAGPVFNFIFAILAYWLVYTVGVEQRIPMIGEVYPDSIAAQADLRPGDEITHVDDHETKNWSAVVRQIVPYIGEQTEIKLRTIDKEKNTQEHILDLSSWEITPRQEDLFESLGFEPYYTPLEPIIETVADSEPAQIAGMKAGDRIIAANDEEITDWNRFVKLIHANALKPMMVRVDRQGELLDFEVIPRVRSYINEPDKGYLGVTVKVPKERDTSQLRVERWGPLESLQMALSKTWSYIKMTYVILGKMITGDISIDNLSGPITIAQGAGASVTTGWVYFVGFLAIISISLGVLNLLPIPILDGGHLLYYTIEAIIRRPVPVSIQVIGYKFGTFVIIFLMFVALYNDILRMF